MRSSETTWSARSCKVVGSTATALIGVVSGIAKLLNGFTGVLPGAAAATDSGSRSSYLLIV